MDTPVGRATKASQWRYPYPPDPTDKQRVAIVASRLAFKDGAAWSRTDALHDPTEEQVEVMARMATEEVSGCDWESFGEDARDFHRGSARRRLTAALRAAYATGGTA